MDDNLIATMNGNPKRPLSRFEAFVQLVKVIKMPKEIEGKEKDFVTISYSTLARWWHWTRPTVSLFIGQLCSLEVISRRKEGNNFVITIHPNYDDKIQVKQ